MVNIHWGFASAADLSFKYLLTDTQRVYVIIRGLEDEKTPEEKTVNMNMYFGPTRQKKTVTRNGIWLGRVAKFHFLTYALADESIHRIP